MSVSSPSAHLSRSRLSIPFPLRALLLLCVCSAGCAQTANVRCWQPADIAAGNLLSLAVVGAEDEIDQRTAVELERKIQRERSLEPVAHPDAESSIVPAAYLEDGTGLNGRTHDGGEADAEVVVIVDVREFEIYDRSRHEWSWGGLWGSMNGSRAEVRVNFELVDSRTSELLASREIHRHADIADADSSDSDQLLERLLDECIDEFVAELGPRETESPIELAEGEWLSLSGSAVRRGVRFAQSGRWQQAAAAWKKALARNAHDDAALFNLAVASAQAGDYVAAEDYAMEALRIRHTECYADGLEQIRELRSASEAAEHQLRMAVVPAGVAGRTDSLLR